MSRKSKESPEKPPLTDAMLEKIILKAVVLFFAAVLIYIPAMGGGYIYDDNTLLYENPAIRRGVGFLDSESWAGLGSLWFPKDASVSADYAPLASTTFWFEWRLWGNNLGEDGVTPEPDPHFQGLGAPGYHITNILLHGIAALLLWYLLAQIGIPGAWVAALVWAVHPVCAESVAWISERRNTLSMCLFMLTMVNWFKFQRTRQWGVYYLAVFLFLLTMLAKTSIVMLPLVLLLCVWWMRDRVTASDILESVPFFVISFIFGVITLYFQNARAINRELVFILPPIDRIPGACFALGFYFYKALCPLNLNLIYQQWHMTVPHSVPGLTPEQILLMLNDPNHPRVPYSFYGVARELIIGVNFAAFFYWAWLRRATWGRHAIFGMGFYVLMLVPVLGFTRMAYMRLTLVSDHFQYAPMVGVIALCVAGLVEVHKRLEPSFKPVLVAVGIGFIIAFGALTVQRANAFSVPKNLWEDNLRKNPDSWQGHSHLGAILWRDHDVDGALHEWEQSAALAPYLYEVHNNYALALNAKGRTNEALAQYKIAVGIEPEQWNVRGNYIQTLINSHHYEEAIQQYQAMLENPVFKTQPTLYANVGTMYMQLDKLDEAIAYYKQALEIAKNNGQTYPDAEHLLQAARLKRAQEFEQSNPPPPKPSPESAAPAPPPNAPAGLHLTGSTTFPTGSNAGGR